MSKADKVIVELKKVKKELIELLPKKFRKSFKKESFIGGGAIYSLYNNEEPKDYDFFLTSEKLASDLRVYFHLYIIGKNKELSGKKIKVSKYRNKRLVLTDNGISIGQYQIITRWVGKPEEVVSEFDFKHNMFYYYKDKIATLVDWNFLDDNKLRYNEQRARDICGTIIRVKKFVERGFTITNKEMSKMLLKLSEVGFNEREKEILKDAERDFES